MNSSDLWEGVIRREDLGGRGELRSVDIGHCCARAIDCIVSVLPIDRHLLNILSHPGSYGRWKFKERRWKVVGLLKGSCSSNVEFGPAIQGSTRHRIGVSQGTSMCIDCDSQGPRY